MKEYIIQAPEWEVTRIEQNKMTCFGQPVTELIRCKDCKYYKVYELFNHTLPLCDRIKTTMADALEEDDYCSRAERRDNEPFENHKAD